MPIIYCQGEEIKPHYRALFPLLDKAYNFSLYVSHKAISLTSLSAL